MSRKRPFGVRQQDWAAIKNFEYDKLHHPPAPNKPVVVHPPCRCDKRPFAHYHPGQLCFEELK